MDNLVADKNFGGASSYLPKPIVSGISGSPRKGGNSDVLLKQVLKGVKEKNNVTHEILLRDYQYQGCIGCERCRKDKICTGLKDGMALIYPKIIESKGLVLASPTHNYNITAWMKGFIDRLYCFYDFNNNRPRGWSSRFAGQGRKAVLVAICEQEQKEDMGFTLDAMRIPLQAFGYEVIGELPVLSIFDRGKVKENHELMDKAKQLGADLADAING